VVVLRHDELTAKKGERVDADQAPDPLGVALLQHSGGCHGRGQQRKPDFIVSEYRDDERAGWRPTLPQSCPCACGAAEPCRVAEHSYRERRCGPGHALVVVRCRAHGRFFTLYPPGFVPYGRQALPTTAAEVETAPALRAVRDAAAATTARWPDYGALERSAWASTQWRHLGHLGTWLGLRGAALLGQQVAAALYLPLHEHAAARKDYETGGYRQRGQALLRVLRAVGRRGALWPRLLRAGHVAGVIGRAVVVVHRTGQVRSLPAF
jgi:hypothetical protein